MGITRLDIDNINFGSAPFCPKCGNAMHLIPPNVTGKIMYHFWRCQKGKCKCHYVPKGSVLEEYNQYQKARRLLEDSLDE